LKLLALSIFLAFEFCDADLALLVDFLAQNNKSEYLNTAEIKCILLQLLKAVEYIHQRGLMHRDLKLSNLLLSKTGQLKVADFGLARKLEPFNPSYTPKVVTLWYRAPEILLRT